MAEPATLPRWDLTSVLPAVGDPEFDEAFARATAEVTRLGRLFDERGVGPSAGSISPAAFDEVLGEFLRVRTDVYQFEAYLECLTAADSRDDPAQARLSALQPSLAALSILQTRLSAWVGSSDVETLLAASAAAREHEHFLRQSVVRARHLMSPAEEDLAAHLVLTGSTAWEKLHANLTSLIVVPLEVEGEVRSLPMSAVRNLAQHADRALRRRAYEAEQAAWSAARVPLAAAMNSIKGEVNLLARRRGWESPLEATLFEHALDRPILEAMTTAVADSFPDFHRYLRAKARALGLDSLAWFDLYAPLGDPGGAWSFERARAFIEDHFGSFSPLLLDTARRAFAEAWIDAEPRQGKVGGAFCMWIRQGESRVLANFVPTYSGMSTLAHELGHAYHNRTRAGRSILQRRTPSTLAETASIFCETLVGDAAYQAAGAAERLSILESFLQTACAVVVDIAGRFRFEQWVFERRQERELSPDELCGLMLEAHRQTYGDGLDPSTYHPYMWAVKPHYYSGSASFYNYPYTFGLLFGLGLFAIYRESSNGFAERYEDLLSRTGMATAADLARDFGLDLRTPGFWRASLDMIRERIARFEALV